MEKKSFNLFAIILVQQLLITLAKNIEQSLEVSQVFDGADDLSNNRVTNEKMFLRKASDQSSNYLNYKAVYGLRFIPTTKLQKEQTKVVSREHQNVTLISSNTVEVISASKDELNDNFALSSNETVKDSTNESSQKVEVIKNTEPVSVMDESKKHIMRPNSRIEHVLEFLAGRLKKLKVQTSHSHILPANLSPQLTTLGRFLNLFSLIQVENLPCLTAMKPLKQLSGTCFNENDCHNLGGTAVDRCANGFGVCCICKLLLALALFLKKIFFFFSQIRLQLCFSSERNIFREP